LIPKILLDAGQILGSAVEQHKIVDQLDQPVLATHLQQIFVQFEATVVFLIFLPPEKVLLRREDGAVLKSLRVIALEDELHGREKRSIELRLLV